VRFTTLYAKQAARGVSFLLGFSTTPACTSAKVSLPAFMPARLPLHFLENHHTNAFMPAAPLRGRKQHAAFNAWLAGVVVGCVDYMFFSASQYNLQLSTWFLCFWTLMLPGIVLPKGRTKDFILLRLLGAQRAWTNCPPPSPGHYLDYWRTRLRLTIAVLRRHLDFTSARALRPRLSAAAAYAFV